MKPNITGLFTTKEKIILYVGAACCFAATWFTSYYSWLGYLGTFAFAIIFFWTAWKCYKSNIRKWAVVYCGLGAFLTLIIIAVAAAYYL